MKNNIIFIVTVLIFSHLLIGQQLTMEQRVQYQELLRQYPQLGSMLGNQSTQSFPITSGGGQQLTGLPGTSIFGLDSLQVLDLYGDTTLVAEEETIDYFGYTFFNIPDQIAVLENLPVPAEYRLGPGDEITVTLWGETDLREASVIDLDGNIFIEQIGMINLLGLNLAQSEVMLKSRFGQIYSTLRGDDPKTYINVALGRLKSINVTFVGEVLLPGIHAIHPFSFITSGLIQVNGVQYRGSLRNIHIIRNEEIVATLDFYEYLLRGKTADNIRLLDGDIVFVPPRKSSIGIEGEVARPGLYEGKDNESIHKILDYAGGLTQKAQSTIEVKQIIPHEQRISDDYAYNAFYVNYFESEFTSSRGVVNLLVLPLPDVERVVSIVGKVKSPGEYAFEDSMKVLDLLNISGGINDETFWKSMYTKQAEIIRRSSVIDYPTRILIDLDGLKNGDESQNFRLHNLDILLIRENLNFISPRQIKVTGEVNVPGIYTIQKKEESLSEIITRAGGFSSNAFGEGLKLYRDSLQIVLKDNSIAVIDEDSIFVPQHPGTVNVEGNIFNPGLVQYIPGKSLKDYIESAGGFTPSANRKIIAVHYANGDVKLKKSRWYTPPVREGSTITVYKKPPSDPFDVTEFLKELASVTASFATIYYIITATN